MIRNLSCYECFIVVYDIKAIGELHTDKMVANYRCFVIIISCVLKWDSFLNNRIRIMIGEEVWNILEFE